MAISEHAEEKRTLHFGCSFCGDDKEYEIDAIDVFGQQAEEKAKLLEAEGWEERESDSIDGLACRSCVLEIDKKEK